MKEFFDMGGYGAYVWSAYGLTVLVLFWNWFDARRRFARARDSARARAGAGKAGRS